jgi:hypothetical protein
MSGRFFLLLLLLAALVTAATFFYETETEEMLSEPGLADMVRRAGVHGWPWGYYAEVTERSRLDKHSVAVFEYSEIRLQMLGQTYVAWFVLLLILVSVVIVVTDPRRRGG